MTHECETCEREFLRKEALYGHQRVHKEEARRFFRASQRQRIKLAQALTHCEDPDARKEIREAMQLGDAIREAANVE